MRLTLSSLALSLALAGGLAAVPASSQSAGGPSATAAAVKCKSGYIRKTVTVRGKRVQRCVKDTRTCYASFKCGFLRSRDGRIETNFGSGPTPVISFPKEMMFPIPGCAPEPTDPLGAAVLGNMDDISNGTYRVRGTRVGATLIQSRAEKARGGASTSDGRAVGLQIVVTGKWTTTTTIVGAITAIQTRQQRNPDGSQSVTDRCQRTIPMRVIKTKG